MANLDAPFGFRIVGSAAGGTPGRINSANKWTIAGSYATSIFEGDLVKLHTDGTVVLGTAGDAYLGIFAGVEYIATDGSVQFRNMWTASTAIKSGTVAKALVYDDPNAVFIAQCSGTLAATDIGQFVDLANTAGDTATGRSRQEVNAGGSTETNFRVLGLHDVPGNDWGEHVVVRLGLAEHQLGLGVVAAEV